MQNKIKADTRRLFRLFATFVMAVTMLIFDSGTAHAQSKTGQVTPNAQLPQVNVSISITPISSPNYSAPASIMVTGSAFSLSPVIDVTLFKDGVMIGTGSRTVQVTLANLAAGTYVFEAVANNQAGGTASTSQTVTINPTDVLPTISLISPTNGQSFEAGIVVNLSATASDSDGSISKVEFYVDGSLVSESTASPYSFGWMATTGYHVVVARATDNVGGSTMSGAVGITVNAPANVPPTVSLTSPTNGQTFTAGQVVTLSATASD